MKNLFCDAGPASCREITTAATSCMTHPIKTFARVCEKVPGHEPWFSAETVEEATRSVERGGRCRSSSCLSVS